MQFQRSFEKMSPQTIAVGNFQNVIKLRICPFSTKRITKGARHFRPREGRSSYTSHVNSLVGPPKKSYSLEINLHLGILLSVMFTCKMHSHSSQGGAARNFARLSCANGSNSKGSDSAARGRTEPIHFRIHQKSTRVKARLISFKLIAC